MAQAKQPTLVNLGLTRLPRLQSQGLGRPEFLGLCRNFTAQGCYEETI